jgi:hypothetical protein
MGTDTRLSFGKTGNSGGALSRGAWGSPGPVSCGRLKDRVLDTPGEPFDAGCLFNGSCPPFLSRGADSRLSLGYTGTGGVPTRDACVSPGVVLSCIRLENCILVPPGADAANDFSEAGGSFEGGGGACCPEEG